MKRKLLKRSFVGLFVALVAIFSFADLLGQATGEVLTGGGMGVDDESAWTVFVGPGASGGPENPTGDEVPEYEFGYDEECAFCTDEVLRVNAAGIAYVNIVFYQEITLKAGHTYKADGAVKDLTGELQNWWAQLKISLTGEPPKHENDGIKLMGFNVWQGCGQYADTNFAQGACDWMGLNPGEIPNLDGGIGFVAPDSLGAEFTAYFALVTGLYTDGTPYPYDVIFDNISLIDSTELASVSVRPLESNPEASLLNFPNPFRQTTTIRYNIPEKSYVKLSVYNLLGQEVASLYKGIREPGSYETRLDASEFANNVLICKLEYNDRVIVRKMTLFK